VDITKSHYRFFIKVKFSVKEVNMKAIETNTLISDDRILTLQLPREIPVGRHHIFVVIDEQPVEPMTQTTPTPVNRQWQKEGVTQKEEGVTQKDSQKHRKTEIHAAVVAYATQHAGTEMDLDHELEEAGIECLNKFFDKNERPK
jgi:hypothetical protein